MTIVKSMRGQSVDFTSLLKNNESQIALNAGSGIRMNARGDIIDSKGNIIKKVEDIEREENIKIDREKISLNNSEKMKKFFMKRKFMTPEEIQENIRKLEKEKKELKEKLTKNVDLVQNISFNTHSSEEVFKDDEGEDKETKKPKKQKN